MRCPQQQLDTHTRQIRSIKASENPSHQASNAPLCDTIKEPTPNSRRFRSFGCPRALSYGLPAQSPSRTGKGLRGDPDRPRRNGLRRLDLMESRSIDPNARHGHPIDNPGVSSHGHHGRLAQQARLGGPVAVGPSDDRRRSWEGRRRKPLPI